MKKKLIDIKELENCACFNLRSMARELTNDYNESLKSLGINITQVPILAILNFHGEIETVKIARILNLEKSTARRNLSILIGLKLIKVISKDSKGNTLSLTNKGFIKLHETLPIWRKLQKNGKNKVKKYLKILEEII